MLNEQLQKEIIEEAKNFAFYNYVSAAHNGSAVFDEIESWPDSAQVAYYAIVNYMNGTGVCWPFHQTTLPMKWQAAEQRIKELEQWKKEAAALLNPLLDWGQAQKDIPLGCDITKEILRRAQLFGKYENVLKEIASGKALPHMIAQFALTPKTSSDE